MGKHRQERACCPFSFFWAHRPGSVRFQSCTGAIRELSSYLHCQRPKETSFIFVFV